MDNQIDVFAKTFLGLTVSCARCHDHKFDAITTKDYYALAGYLQSSRYQQAYIDSPDRHREQLAALETLHAEQQAALAAHARATAAEALAQLPAALLAAPSTVAADWAKALYETARNEVDHPLHAWAQLAQRGPNRPTYLPVPATNCRPAGTAKRNEIQTTTFADFSAADYGDWIATGAAFGKRPARAGEACPHPVATSSCSPARQPTAAAYRCKLQGALRSPTFEITAPKIFYRLHGNGGKVRLILDGLQLIRNPIYGGLEFGPENRPRTGTPRT